MIPCKSAMIPKPPILRNIILFLLSILILCFALFGLSRAEARIFHSGFPDTGHQPVPRYNTAFTVPDEGYAIYVDLDTLQLTLFKDGTEFKKWPVSGGAKNSPSPLGLWKVNGIGHWGEGFGGSWISINVPWGKYGIHGTVEPWEVGRTNRSHGCIRMKNADVRELKKYVRWGTPVYITQQNVPFRALKDGHIGSDVLEVQEILLMLGHYHGTPDGRFGAGTRLAVQRFQKASGIKADGVVGWHTYNLLLNAFD